MRARSLLLQENAMRLAWSDPTEVWIKSKVSTKTLMITHASKARNTINPSQHSLHTHARDTPIRHNTQIHVQYVRKSRFYTYSLFLHYPHPSPRPRTWIPSKTITKANFFCLVCCQVWRDRKKLTCLKHKTSSRASLSVHTMDTFSYFQNIRFTS